MRQNANRMRIEPLVLSAADFEARVISHEAFTAGRVGGQRALRRYIVARDMRCDRRRLNDVDLTGSDLQGTSFIGAYLERASFNSANLSRCNFTAAMLMRSDMRAARLVGVTMKDALLDGADLRAAILSGTDEVPGQGRVDRFGSLAGARADDIDLSDTTAHGVDFSDCSMVGAKFKGANLMFANLRNANLSRADLGGTRLEGARLEGAILMGVSVDRLDLSPEQLRGCLLDPSPEARARAGALRASVEGMDAWARSGGRSGAPAVLDDHDLRTIGGMAGRALPGVSARNVVAVGVDLRGAELAGANFDGADLRNADLREADLRGVSFRGANLAHARLADALLTPLTLVSGQVRPVALEGAIVAGTGLRPAVAEIVA
ncbi:MAG: low-complexity protein [Phenylobacterium zucineum]|nr:MAG: low-complexity protein [Phenylobacterium zucineum]